MPADNLVEILQANKQDKLIEYLMEIDEKSKDKLIERLSSLDLKNYFNILKKDISTNQSKFKKLDKPFVFEQGKFDSEKYKKVGLNVLKNKEVGFFIVAGGQGSRLGFEHPKGMFPISPICNKTLFQIHLEKVIACGRYYGFKPYLFIMTSSTNHDETVQYFKNELKDLFNLSNIYFFNQRDLPAVDLDGNLILSDSLAPFTAPDGHGGALLALKNSSMIDIMKENGIKYLSYFQVDNPLVNIADPVFLGLHILEKSEVSSKVLPKRSADEKVGVASISDGKAMVVEYSDLPQDLATKKDSDGRLLFNYGSIAIHIFSTEFINRITTKDLQLPYHIAKKKIPYFDIKTKKIVNPDKPNGIKMEQFIFDSIPMAENAIFYETIRENEFSPLKNKDGEDSIYTCKNGISNFYKNWFKLSNIEFEDENSTTVEVSSFFAFTEDEFKIKIKKYVNKVPKKLYLE